MANRHPGVRRCAPTSPGRIRGQALVLTVALLGVLCLGALLLFNTGQSVNAKLRLTNAVDAAAYSVAAEQARAMNFAAYMNRGRVANEVAVAQMVSMHSWTNNLHTHVGMFDVAFSELVKIPIIGLAFVPLQVIYKAAREALNAVRTPALMKGYGAVVAALDVLDGFYADSAAQVIREATTVDRAELAREVLVRNDPAAEFVPAGLDYLLDTQLAAARSDFIEHHDLPERTSPGMDRYRNVVMESRDELARDRNARMRIGDPNNYSFDFPIPIGGFELRNENWVVSEGGTDMVEYDRWAALDTTSFDIEVEAFVYVGRCVPILGCVRVKKTLAEGEIKTPMGHGGAQAVESAAGQRFRPGINDDAGFSSFYETMASGRPAHYAPYNGVRGLPGLAAENEPAVTNFVYGDRNARRGDEFLEDYEGLRAYHDVRAARARAPDDGPVFTVYARSAEDRVRTSDVIGVGGGEGTATHLAGAADGGAYTALASAQVYFARPTALQRFRRVFRRGAFPGGEAGSLFSPYWQARLVDTPDDARAALGIQTP